MTRWTMICAVVLAVGCSGDDKGEGTGGLEGDPVAGEAIYTTNCTICHGADGSGGTGPDITGESDELEVVEVVTEGEGGMPAFGSSLSEQEIADVSAFVTQSL